MFSQIMLSFCISEQNVMAIVSLTDGQFDPQQNGYCEL